MEKLLEKLDGGSFVGGSIISRSWAIYNPHLLRNFLSHRDIVCSRIENDPAVFYKKDWMRSGNELKKYVDYVLGPVVGGRVYTSLSPIYQRFVY